MQSNFQEAWRSQPVFRMVVIIGPIVVMAAIAFGLFGMGSDPDDASEVERAANVREAPGQEVSPAYAEAIVDASRGRADVARQQGGSAINTPVGRGPDDMTSRFDNEFPIDPLSPWEEPEPQLQALPPAPAAIAPPPPPPPDYSGLIDAMRNQMSQLMTAWQPQPVGLITVTQVTDEVAPAQPGPPVSEPLGPALIRPGEVFYGYMLTQASSAVPGPILAEIVSGPFTGARLLGGFSVADEYLVLQFNAMTIDDRAYEVQAVALDPDTTLAGVATRVDHHYFTRVVLPAASAFISAFAEAFAERDSTVTINDSGVVVEDIESPSTSEELAAGGAAAASTVSNLLSQEASSITTTVEVAAGTPVGLLFINPVREPIE